MKPTWMLLAIAVGIGAATQTGIASIKVRTQFDKAFDFQQARTWDWNPKGRGQVILARTPEDDPAAMQQRAEPVIVEAVGAEMPRRGFERSAASPDLTLTYYLLLTAGTSTQTIGQFLPSVTAWGLPPFAAATQSIEAIEQGSLVLDISAKGEVIWRGIAEGPIKIELDQQQRTAMLRDAVEEVVSRVPRRK